jgi:hypothetical protein
MDKVREFTALTEPNIFVRFVRSIAAMITRTSLAETVEHHLRSGQPA